MSDDDEDELTLDDLGAAYARAAARHDPESFAVTPPPSPADVSGDGAAAEDLLIDPSPAGDGQESVIPPTPEAIIEAALFIGHPKNEPLTLQRLASLIRDVTTDEVREIIDQLNESYERHEQALRIVPHQNGFRLTIAAGVEAVRRGFTGKTREFRLSQAMVEVLALVAYQSGITAQQVQDQRGHESLSVLNQLVRRQLVEIRRDSDTPAGPKSAKTSRSKATPRYHVTERLLTLLGLESLDDLPQVEEGLASP